MKSCRTTLTAALIALAAAAGTARADDNIVTTISIPSGQPVPVIQNNGVPSGTIRLNYVAVGYSFPCGDFAQFNAGLLDTAGNGSKVPGYPATLTLAQSGGGTPVQLSMSPSSFVVSGLGWSDSSLVTVSIDCSKTPVAPADGTVIDGQFNEAGPAHLGTISTVQVHILLVHPTTCIKLYSFETDQDSGDLVTSLTVNTSRGLIRATNPGQLSVDALVVNTCSTSISFDLQMGLDPAWQTSPTGNPGVATFTYTTAGEFDPSTFNLAAWQDETKHGEDVCLSNITLAAGDSFLTRVHAGIINQAASALPSDGDFDFGATLTLPGTGCAGTLLSPVSASNPAASKLPFTIH